VLAASLLTACTPSHPVTDPTKTPTPTPTPVFTSDAEALAAATEVYKKYMKASDDIAHDGGAHPERVKPFVSEAGYQHELQAAEDFKADNAHGTGYAVLNNVILESYEEHDGVATVKLYTCEDISEVDRVDAAGKSLVQPDRGDFIAYQPTFKSDSDGRLVIQSDPYWSGGGICKF
jgi:hypothetical protein